MFHPHTETDRKEMLKTIGVDKLEDLFQVIPQEHRFPDLNLPAQMTEMEIQHSMLGLSELNETHLDLPMFLGAGAYNHYIPAAVDSILRRGEFYTAYTPYQPEISQGTLQAIFEFQSHVTNLTGMDVSNASHYDGATATAEAVNMARQITRNKKSKAVISPALHPHYRATVDTYLQGDETFKVVGDDVDPALGPDALLDLIDDDTAVVVVQYPDFFGRVYDLTDFAAKVHEKGSLLAVAVNPLALALFKSPGDFDADIVSGEGQPLGVPLSFGGPYLGLLATKDKYVRTIAGRLVGETTDVNGERGFVLTLSTREQHIKRERAGSNICSNQGLMMLAATVHVSLLGKEGLREVANLNYQKAHYAASEIDKIEGYELWSDATFFNEFVVKCPRPAAELNEGLLEAGLIGGYDLGQDYPGMENYMLVAVTEMNTREQIDYFLNVLEELG